jgi:predicted nucleotidyltransferase
MYVNINLKAHMYIYVQVEKKIAVDCSTQYEDITIHEEDEEVLKKKLRVKRRYFC